MIPNTHNLAFTDPFPLKLRKVRPPAPEEDGFNQQIKQVFENRIPVESVTFSRAMSEALQKNAGNFLYSMAASNTWLEKMHGQEKARNADETMVNFWPHPDVVELAFCASQSHLRLAPMQDWRDDTPVKSGIYRSSRSKRFGWLRYWNKKNWSCAWSVYEKDMLKVRKHMGGTMTADVTVYWLPN